MAFMSKGRKQDLIKLATELGEEVEGDLKVIELRELILETSIYKEDLDFGKNTLENILTERLEREERERVADEKESIERDKAYELKKRLQLESQKLEQISGLELLPAEATFNLKKLLPDFDPQSCKGACAKCNPMVQRVCTQAPPLNHMNFYSILTESQPSSIIEITICGSQAAVCADTGATHSVVGETLYHFLKNNGRRFENSTVDMALTDGHVQKTDILTTTVDIGMAGKVIPTKLIALKNSKRNRTLLGTDFLRAAGIVLDLQKGLCYFSEAPHQSFNFIEPPADIKSFLVVHVASHPCQLRENEGTHLSDEQRTKFNSLLKGYEKCFQPGGEPTPFIEHRINTGHHFPVAVPPYRMYPTKKETLKQEIDRLLAEGIIEEYESPYASPVVLIPKANVADMLSRPVCDEKEFPYEVSNIAIADLSVRSARDMREVQLADENLKKIIIFADADSEEAQLVIPSFERDSIMEKHHDDPMVGYYGEEVTFQRISKRYYWTGMRKYINDYVKNCPECNRYKANNQKPPGLLRTPVYSQRFEIISIDLLVHCQRLKMVSNGYLLLSIVQSDGLNYFHYLKQQLVSAPLHTLGHIPEIWNSQTNH
ncbi:Transposon Ty3-I Gag-Pol polyprotein like [Argiope bruennichi]|uniref:RNA-directed DNA polymerase n=1 Tax=Argiope bruennichi TaxID=94029 RepID=A0A8T0FCW4_ARGBR|nr:Transposon Ty3-I Gag-Pol polyprotein like [Argiope bruennichi]